MIKVWHVLKNSIQEMYKFHTRKKNYSVMVFEKSKVEKEMEQNE